MFTKKLITIMFMAPITPMTKTEITPKATNIGEAAKVLTILTTTPPTVTFELSAAFTACGNTITATANINNGRIKYFLLELIFLNNFFILCYFAGCTAAG